MGRIINIYCDESCHLPNDAQKAMVLGALWCFKDKAREHNRAIAELKVKHHLSPFFEIKWTKTSSGKLEFYKELINYFFDSRAMGFRAWVIPDKTVLSHDEYEQTHDEWYYKMYFYLLRNIIRTDRHILKKKDYRTCVGVNWLPWVKALIEQPSEPEVHAWDYEEGDLTIKTYVWLKESDFIVIMKKYPDGKRRLITSFYVDSLYKQKDFERKYAKRLN